MIPCDESEMASEDSLDLIAEANQSSLVNACMGALESSLGYMVRTYLKTEQIYRKFRDV